MHAYKCQHTIPTVTCFHAIFLYHQAENFFIFSWNKLVKFLHSFKIWRNSNEKIISQSGRMSLKATVWLSLAMVQRLWEWWFMDLWQSPCIKNCPDSVFFTKAKPLLSTFSVQVRADTLKTGITQCLSRTPFLYKLLTCVPNCQWASAEWFLDFFM